MAETVEERREEAGPAKGAAAPARGLLREYFESGAVVLVMALFFMTFVAQAAEVPSASMESTILVGDRFLINKFIFAPGPPAPFLPQREIRRGDIIVFKYPARSDPAQKIVQYETLFVKRVIGLPGETIHVRGAGVQVNGRPLPERRLAAGDDAAPQPLPADTPYTVYNRPETLNADGDERASAPFNFAAGEPYKVPDGHYFVMGDNRDNSADSRVWGPVPRELVVGRAMFVIWSFDSGLQRSDAAPPFNLLSDLVNNTRWGRIGTMLR